MDFKTPKPPTIWAAWPGTVTDVGLHTRAPAGARRARRTLRPRPVGEAHRRRHPLHRCAGIVGRRRFRGAGAGRGAGGAGSPARRSAVPGVGRAWRGRAGEVRLRGTAAGVGDARGQRREDPRGRARRRDGRGPGAGSGVGAARRRPAEWRVPFTGSRTQVGYGPVADAFLVAGRNRFGHEGFPDRQG